jgi:hypothetical protein
MPNSDMPKPGTYTPEDYRAYIRSLMILIAGGAPRNGERDRWLEKISGLTGIGFSTLSAAHKGRWISKNQYVSNNTREKLEAVAAHARKTKTLVEFVELQIDIWETAPEIFDEHRIGLARDFVTRLRRYDAERSRSRIPAHDDSAGAAAATSAVAARS